MKTLVVVGAGGFGREVVQIVAAVNLLTPTWDLLGVLDDDVRAVDRLGGVTLLGAVADLDRFAEHHAVVAVGSPAARAAIVGAHPDQSWATLVHPDATVSPDARIGAGSVIAPGARVSVACTLGGHVHVDQNAAIGHDVRIESFARVNPQACISGAVTIGSGALVGANATVLQGLSVGTGAVIGAGAVVTRNVPEARVVKGVPAR